MLPRATKKITSRTTEARGYEFELFQRIFNYIEQFCQSLLYILLYLCLSRSILDYLGLSWSISLHLGVSWCILVYLGLSRSISAIVNFLELSWTILD